MDKPTTTTTPSTEPIIWRCEYCELGRSKPAKRLPSGWKRHQEHTICDGCWASRYALRAVTLPIVAPLDCTWHEFDTAMREMWALTTQMANWIMTESYARDVRRAPGEVKIPPYQTPYLYPEARERFGGLPSQTTAAILNTAQAKYRAARFEVVWTCAAALPTYRYPTPFPVPAQGWTVTIEEERPVVSLRIGDQRLRFRLMGGGRYRRQTASIEKMVSGAAVTCEMAVYKAGKDTMCKLVAWLPKEVGAQKDGSTLYVRTGGDALVTALNVRDDKLWVYHADQIARWSAEHRRRLQRWADDQKAEHRPVAPFDQRRREAAHKYRDRMSSVSHQVAAMVAGYAARRKFAKVVYHDDDQAVCEGFPWFRLRELISQKLNERGITFEHAAPAKKETEGVVSPTVVE